MARIRETGGVDGMVDWKRQAEAMVLLLAEEDGAVAGAGFALTGWHTPAHRAIGSTLVVPEQRGHGVGDEIRETIEGWARDHGATELDAAVAEDDDGSLAWAAARGYEEAGRNSRLVLDLTAIESPSVSPPPGIEIVTWAERPELAEGLWEVAREAGPDIPGEEDTDVGSFEEWLDRDMRGSGDRPEAVFVALEAGEVLGYAKLSFSSERAERPDPSSEREARLRARAGGRVRARNYRLVLRARSICRFASRSAIVRRLSPFSLPRASASSTFTRPSLK